MGLNLLNTTDFGPKNEKLFDVQFTDTDINLVWDLVSGLAKYNFGDARPGEFYSENGFNTSFADSSLKTLSVYKGASSGPRGFKYFYLYNEDLSTGTLDVSSLTHLEFFSVQYSNLTNIIFADHSTTPLALNIGNNNLTGTIDLSGLKNLKDNLQLNDNPNLTQVIFPTSIENAEPLTYIYLRDSDIQGILDISGLTNWRGTLNAVNNRDCSGILFPDTSADVTSLDLWQMGLTSIDLSGLTGLRSYVSLSNNYTMQSIILPETSAYFSTIVVRSCDLQGEQDLRHLTGNIQSMDWGSNNITSLLLADCSFPFTTFNFSSNDLVTVDVSNRMFNGIFSLRSNPTLTHVTLPDASCQFSQLDFGYNSQFTGNTSTPGVLDVSQHHISYSITLTACDVSVLLFDTDKCQDLQSLYLDNTKLHGTLDVSSLTNLRTLDIGKNTTTGPFTELLLPPGAPLSTLDIVYSDIYHGTMDISMLSTIEYLRINYCDVSVILWPADVSSSPLRTFEGYECNFSGNFDISNFYSLGGAFQCYNNNITSFTFPDASMSGGGSIRIQNNNLIGALDLSSLVKANYYFDGNNNLNLENVLWPVFEHPLSYVRWNDCSLNQTTVDGLLSNIVANYTDFYPTPSYNLTISLHGGNNAPPTDGSMNVDISTLEYIFGQSTKNLILTYNT
jgi:hypothetical protein